MRTHPYCLTGGFVWNSCESSRLFSCVQVVDMLLTAWMVWFFVHGHRFQYLAVIWIHSSTQLQYLFFRKRKEIKYKTFLPYIICFLVTPFALFKDFLIIKEKTLGINWKNNKKESTNTQRCLVKACFFYHKNESCQGYSLSKWFIKRNTSDKNSTS